MNHKGTEITEEEGRRLTIDNLFLIPHSSFPIPIPWEHLKFAKKTVVGASRSLGI
jgi:hypothetical protein